MKKISNLWKKLRGHFLRIEDQINNISKNRTIYNITAHAIFQPLKIDFLTLTHEALHQEIPRDLLCIKKHHNDERDGWSHQMDKRLYTTEKNNRDLGESLNSGIIGGGGWT